MTQLAKIGSLWIGGPLSWLEVASIQSFLRLGHDYTLYSYDPVPNAPEGTILADARDVWDTDRILIHDTAKSPAIHADVFRARMIMQEGNVWADTDVIALRPFPADLGWFIGHERDDKVLLGNAIMGMPEGSATKQAMYDFLTAEYPIPPWAKGQFRKDMLAKKDAGEAVRLESLSWGTTGPQALTWFAKETGEIEHAQPSGTFFPVGFNERKRLVKAADRPSLEAQIEAEQSLCVHLYSRWLRKYTADMPGGLPPQTSWLGAYLSEHGLADYSDLPLSEKALRKQKQAEAKKAAKAKGGNAPKVDPQVFFDDLNTRKKAIPGGANTSAHGRVSLVTMAKDEGPYVLEWVAYHHLLGFTDILAFTNDCTDGTDEMLDALAALGLVTRLENGPMRDLPPQSRALKRATVHPLVTASDYIMVMDFDEFLCVKTEAGGVDSLIDLMHRTDTDAMAVTWRFFGSAGETRYRNAPVTQRLTQAANDRFSLGFGVKTLFKNLDYLRLAIHRPRGVGNKKNPDIKLPWINGSAKPVDGRVMTWRQTMQSAGYDYAQVNHYGVKTHEEYLMRRLRGDVLNNHGKYDAAYFLRYDRNDIEDTHALRLEKELKKLLTALRRDKGVKAAEKLVNERYAEKLARLRGSEGYDAMMAELKAPEPVSS